MTVYKHGIDISTWQGNIDLRPYRDQFVIIRAGFDLTTDNKAVRNMDECARLGIPFGVYWYSYALDPVQARREAMACLQVIKGRKISVGVWIDMEDADHWKKKHGFRFNRSNVSAICNAFCEVAEQAGYYTGIYASKSWMDSYIDCPKYDKWVASWGTNNGQLQNDTSAYGTLHQYTSKPLDKNVMYVPISTYTADKEDVPDPEPAPMETKISHVPTMFTFMDVGKKKTLVTQVNDGTKPTYKTSDPKVATVSKGGVITATGAGKATITVTAGKATKDIAVTVPKFHSLLEVTEPIHKAAVAQAKWMEGFDYEWKGAAKQTIAESRRFGTCVTYANCVLYRLGILKEKSYIYQDEDGDVTYNGATATLRKDCKARAKKYLVVKRVKNERPYKLKDTLKRGDILMYTKGTIKAGPGSHICIFAGEWAGTKAVVWDNNWAKSKMKKKSTFDKPLDSYIRIHRFYVYTQAENGTITTSNSYLAAETVTVTYSGKKPIKSLVVDGKKVDPAKYPSSYTFKDLKANHTIKVTFE